MRTVTVLLILMPALLFGRCTCSSDSVNRGDLNVVPLGQEWQMGEQLAAEIARTQPLVDDPVLQEYVARLGAQLVEQTEMADRPWQFHVVADPSLNAFAIPGGHVYVNTGLIVAAESPAELAGVMAHEVAHGVARHGTERMTKVYGLSVVGSLVLGEDPGLLEQIAAQIIGSGAVARFSRKDETEADALGLDYLYEAGYPPEAMGTMFETLLAQRERRPNLVERFFATHPLTERRIEAVEEAAAALPPRTETAPPLADFSQIQQRAARYGA